jgi:D-glycero-alpha-D-manno-heptose-7-phosphate kinase
MIICKVPYRIPLVGGGTDLDFYYKKKGGFLISASINQYVFISISRRLLHKNNLIQTTDVEFAKNIDQINNKIIKASLKYFKIKNYIHVTTFSTIPTKTGLGSSSSIIVGLVDVISKFLGKNINVIKKYLIGYTIERKILKMDGGHQDQIMAAYGGIQKIKIKKNGTIKISKFKIDEKIIRGFEKKLILVFTSEVRSSESIIKEQRLVDSQEIIHAYDQIKGLVPEFEKALKQKKFFEIGKIFHKHWLMKKKISKSMTNSFLDNFYLKLIRNKNFIGGKIIGAGGGGFFLMVIKNKNEAEKFLKKKKILFLPIKFENEGSKIIHS